MKHNVNKWYVNKPYIYLSTTDFAKQSHGRIEQSACTVNMGLSDPVSDRIWTPIENLPGVHILL